MPNHVHLLIWPFEEEYDIGKILQGINGAMSRRYSRCLKRLNPMLRSSFLEKKKERIIFRFWQRGGGFDRNLFNDKAIHESILYIQNNPVRARLTIQVDHYRWSSAWNAEEYEKFRPIIDRSTVPVKMSKY